ncbi:MAG: hypothetical protein AAFZ87_09340 [Planctomycetota bacterium]
MTDRRAVHPLLLDPSYWRTRLDALPADCGAVWTPRKEQSRDGIEVAEFRLNAHDGVRLWGLFARPTWISGPWHATVRTVGPADRPQVDSALVRVGSAEFVFQEPAGRRLADRVLDVMQVCRLALATPAITGVEVEAPDECRGVGSGDEAVIAERVMLQHRVTEQWLADGPIRGHLP